MNGRDGRHEPLSARLERSRQSDSGELLIMLAAVIAALSMILILPERPLPAMPLAAMAAGLEVRAAILRRRERQAAEQEIRRARKLLIHRLINRPHQPARPPRADRWHR